MAAPAVQAITSQVVEAAQRAMATHGLDSPPTMLADLPCSLLLIQLDAGGAENVVASVASSLRFAEPLQRMADKVMRGIGTAYNGLHLRLEKDARDWQRQQGGAEMLELMYWRACERNSFSKVRFVSQLYCCRFNKRNSCAHACQVLLGAVCQRQHSPE